MGAALAYYTVFSLAPLVVVALAVLSLVFEAESARTQLVAEFANYIGKEGAGAIEAILAQNARSGSSWWTALIGFAVVLFGASGVFAELQDSLNQIWEVKKQSGHAIRDLLKTRLLSFSMVFAIGLLLLTSLLISAGIAAADKYFGDRLPGADLVWEAANVVVSLIVSTLLFATIFRVLPDVRIAWRDVWIGAALTATLFVIGKTLLGLYLGRSAPGSSYGAAGSLIVILVWVYYSSQILFFGAEFTRAFSMRHLPPEKRTEQLKTAAATPAAQEDAREEAAEQSKVTS